MILVLLIGKKNIQRFTPVKSLRAREEEKRSAEAQSQASAKLFFFFFASFWSLHYVILLVMILMLFFTKNHLISKGGSRAGIFLTIYIKEHITINF